MKIKIRKFWILFFYHENIRNMAEKWASIFEFLSRWVIFRKIFWYGFFNFQWVIVEPFNFFSLDLILRKCLVEHFKVILSKKPIFVPSGSFLYFYSPLEINQMLSFHWFKNNWLNSLFQVIHFKRFLLTDWSSKMRFPPCLRHFWPHRDGGKAWIRGCLRSLEKMSRLKIQPIICQKQFLSYWGNLSASCWI